MAAKKKTAPKGKKKTAPKKRKSSLRSAFIMWGKRFALACVFVAVLSWGAVWLFLSNADAHIARGAYNIAMDITSGAGFRVENILVEGRVNSDADMLLGLVNIIKGDPIFSLDPKEAKLQIEKIGWVKSVRVERRLPNTIYIRLEERKPLAIWHHDKKLSLIDEDGVELSETDISRFKDLPMVRGSGAQLKAQGFIALLSAEPQLLTRLDHAALIDGRRWDLHLLGGQQIKLPEDDIGLAMRSVVAKHEENDILSQDVVKMIDARHLGKLIIRTKQGAVQDYKTGKSGAKTHL